MEMAAYLGRKGVPVALVVPFDCTKSFQASDNVARVLNLTHSGSYAYVRGGPGFHGTLANVMSVPIRISTTSISINHRDCMHALLQRFLPWSAITSSALSKKGTALMLVPRDPRLFRSKAAHDKTPIITLRSRPSRQPVRNHSTLKKYKIDSRWVDR